MFGSIYNPHDPSTKRTASRFSIFNFPNFIYFYRSYRTKIAVQKIIKHFSSRTVESKFRSQEIIGLSFTEHALALNYCLPANS